MDTRRIQLHQSQRIAEPAKVDGHHSLRLAVGEVLVTSKIDSWIGVLFHPDPEEFIVISKVQLGTAEVEEAGTKPKSTGTFQ